MAILGLSVGLLAPPGVAAASPTWAPAGSAAIHPGVQTFTAGAQCTSNFVFTSGDTVYLGQAAHCAGTGDELAGDGCATPSLPLGTPVEVEGASHPGVLAYSSWLAMQEVGETDPGACTFNDLALVRLDPDDAARVNPSMPHWGGPTGVATGTAPGGTVYSYGNSELRLGLDLLGPKLGFNLGDSGGGWNHTVLTVTPGLPGDSGSAFLDSGGRALGVLSTLEVLPFLGSNGIGDLGMELDYLRSHTSLGATLATGTEAFNPNQLPLGGLGPS